MVFLFYSQLRKFHQWSVTVDLCLQAIVICARCARILVWCSSEHALAMRPKVMLLDEVTSALDPEVVGEVCWRLTGANQGIGLATVMR